MLVVGGRPGMGWMGPLTDLGVTAPPAPAPAPAPVTVPPALSSSLLSHVHMFANQLGPLTPSTDKAATTPAAAAPAASFMSRIPKPVLIGALGLGAVGIGYVIFHRRK